MLKGINFNFGLNIYSTVVFSNSDFAKIVAFSQNDKRVLGIFSLRMRTNGYLVASWARFTKNHKSATYELLTIRGTYDKLTTMAEVSLENLTL